MSLRIFSLAILITLPTMFCRAQNMVADYQLINVNDKHAAYENPQLQKELQKAHKKLAKRIDVVIGYCPEKMISEKPQSPLSNFLTDILVEIANEYCQKHHKEAVDFSILNFGGIRAPLHAGNITIGDLFEIAPFENNMAIAEIKGSELRKLFQRFKVKSCEPYSKQVTIKYAGEYFFQALIHDQEIDNDKIYRVATLDFILTGGDGIFKGIEIINADMTKINIRNAYINHIKKMTSEGKNVTGKNDKRMSIIPQPR